MDGIYWVWVGFTGCGWVLLEVLIYWVEHTQLSAAGQQSMPVVGVLFHRGGGGGDKGGERGRFGVGDV